MPIAELARRRDIPVQFLEQLFATLRRAGLLRSQRGVKGGYSFARPPRESPCWSSSSSSTARSGATPPAFSPRPPRAARSVLAVDRRRRRRARGPRRGRGDVPHLTLRLARDFARAGVFSAAMSRKLCFTFAGAWAALAVTAPRRWRPASPRPRPATRRRSHPPRRPSTGRSTRKARRRRYYFEYGTTTGYGSQTAATGAGSGTADTGVAVDRVAGADTTYHYRLVATDASGALGSDVSFKAPKPPAAGGDTGHPSNVTQTSATLKGTVIPRDRPRRYFFQYGTSRAYGGQTRDCRRRVRHQGASPCRRRRSARAAHDLPLPVGGNQRQRDDQRRRRLAHDRQSSGRIRWPPDRGRSRSARRPV